MNLLQIDEEEYKDRISFAKRWSSEKKISSDRINQIVSAIHEKVGENQSYYVSGSVATIPVRGVLMPARSWRYDYYEVEHTSYLDIISATAEADADNRVEKIIYEFNTPGGYVDMSDEAAEAIANAKKPTVGILRSMCCSAGIKLASQCGKIISSTEGVMVGSIGTVVELSDWSEWEKSVGVVNFFITNTKSKNKRPDISTEAGKQVVRDEMDAHQEIFEGYLKTGRSHNELFSIEKVHEMNGITVNSLKALELGLIDGIGLDSVGLTSEHLESLSDEDSPINSNHPGGDAMSDGQTKALSALLKEHPEAAAEHKNALSAAREEGSQEERVRVQSLLKGVQVTDTVTTALSTGQSYESFCVDAFETQINLAEPKSVTAPVVAAPLASTEAIAVATADGGGEKLTDAQLEAKANKALNIKPQG